MSAFDLSNADFGVDGNGPPTPRAAHPVLGRRRRSAEIDELDESDLESLLHSSEAGSSRRVRREISLDDLFASDNEDQEGDAHIGRRSAADIPEDGDTGGIPMMTEAGQSVALQQARAIIREVPGPSTRSASHVGGEAGGDIGDLQGDRMTSGTGHRRPSSQRRRLFELAAANRPQQDGPSASDPRQPVESGSAARARQPVVVDLTADDSDEEDVVFMREDRPANGAAQAPYGNPPNGPRGDREGEVDHLAAELRSRDIRAAVERRRVGHYALEAALAMRRREELEAAEAAAPAPRRPAGARIRQAMADIEDALAARQRQMDEIVALENARRHDHLRSPSPPPAPGPRARIGLGGAVYRAGGRHVEFRPARNATDARAAHQAALQVQRDEEAVAVRAEETAFDYLRRTAGQSGRRTADGMHGLIANAFGRYREVYLDDPPMGLAQALAQGRVPAQANGFGQPVNVAAIIAGIAKPTVPDQVAGFASTMDLEALDASEPIEFDDRDNIVKPTKKPVLSCFVCHTKLRLSSNYRTDDDKVWRLRCGHLLDQKCLHTLSTPHTPKELATVFPPLTILPVLDAPSGAKRLSKKRKVVKDAPKEYTWTCPAKGCAREHTSVRVTEDKDWVQRAGEGAVQLFM